MNRMFTLFIFFLFMNYTYGQSLDGVSKVYKSDEVDVQPEFPGGYNALMSFILKNFQMNDYDGKGGEIKISFIVETNGRVTNIDVIQDIEGGMGAEAKRVMEKSLIWTPAELSGRRVRSLYELPIKVAGQ